MYNGWEKGDSCWGWNMELKSASSHNIPAFLVPELSRSTWPRKFRRVPRVAGFLCKLCAFLGSVWGGSNFSKVISMLFHFCFQKSWGHLVISFSKDFSKWCIYMGVSKKKGLQTKPPKWMVKVMEHPIFQMDDVRYHYFRKHPHGTSWLMTPVEGLDFSGGH